MNCPCGTLCIAAAYVAERRSSKEGSRHGCRLLRARSISKLVQLYRAREESSCIYFFAIHGTTVQLGKDLGQAWGWFGAWTPKVLNSTCFGADYTVRDLKIAT